MNRSVAARGVLWCAFLATSASPYVRLTHVEVLDEVYPWTMGGELLAAVFTTDLVGFASLWLFCVPPALLLVGRLAGSLPPPARVVWMVQAVLGVAWVVVLSLGVRALALGEPLSSPIADAIAADLLSCIGLSILLVARTNDLLALLLAGPAAVPVRLLARGTRLPSDTVLAPAVALTLVHLPSLYVAMDDEDGFSPQRADPFAKAMLGYLIVSFFALLCYLPSPASGWKSALVVMLSVVALNFNVAVGTLCVLASAPAA